MNGVWRVIAGIALLTFAGCAPVDRPAAPEGRLINDVSRLNPTPVHDILQLREVSELTAAIAEARRSNLKVSIAGKRHSQGGHAFYEGALVLDMTRFNRVLALDREQKLIRVQSGVTWRQVQDYANAYGLAVKVMQSSNIFTVGGSLGVNAHGRDPNFGPIIQTVQSFRLLRADGTVINVSRTEHPDLFALAIGGFGLFGVILDVDLSLTENVIFRKATTLMDYHGYPEYFAQQVRNHRTVGLHYARLSNAPDTYLRELYATSFTVDQPAGIDAASLTRLDEDEPVAVPRFFFALSRSTEWGKRLNWYLQKTVVDPPGKTEWVSRNNAMRPAVAFLDYDSSGDTDILQEYFVPVERFVNFVDGMRDLFRRRGVNLLNVTVRYVPADLEAFLSYARHESFAFVLYINQRLSPEGIGEAQAWTRELVELCLRQGGTYYLPYQLYPSQEQMQRGYPAVTAFFAKKREYDPEDRFMSKFYAWYGQTH